MDQTPSQSPLSTEPATSTRAALLELLSLAGPTILQMVSYTLMQFVDTLLLARLGHVEATAAGTSGILAFAVISFGIGVLQLVNTLVSQNYGRGEFRACGKYLWQGIWFGLAYSLVILPLVPIAGGMFRTMGHTEEMAHLEAVYLRIVLVTTFVKMMSTAFGQFLLAIDRPRIVFVAAFVGVAANAVAAYAMILGRLGLPSTGIVGAGWAQNIGVSVEAIVLVFVALQPAVRRKFGSLDFSLRLEAMRKLWQVGWPAGAQFVTDVLAWSIFTSLVLAQAGETAMAANIFTFRFMSVSFMPAIGIGTAITALVGRYIGMGREDLAIHRANLGFKVNLVYMLTCGSLFLFFRHQLMHLFTSDPEVLRIGATLLIFAAIYQVSDAMYVSYTGALRGAGDTLVPAVATAILNWGITVGIGYYVARRFSQYGALGPWTAATVYGLTLSTFIYARFRMGYWRGRTLADCPAGIATIAITAPAEPGGATGS